MLDQLEQKGNPGGELIGGALESGIALLVASPVARRVGDAPVDQVRLTGKLGADLPHAVAEADHVVEALPCELAEVLGAAARWVNPALAQDAQRVGVKRLGMAAGADRLDPAVGELLDQRLGDLRARAVPGTQEQDPHPRPTRRSSVSSREARGQIQTGVERAAARSE